MSDKPVFLTREGREKLEAELEYLRSVRRREVAERIHSAKEDGDIMENVAYDDAKNEQAFLEGRILTLEAMLKNAVIIEEGGPYDSVRLGSRVTVMERGGERETFHIVGYVEADPHQGRISNESPLGKALIGHRVGEEVVVHTPDGRRYFQVVEIS